VNSPFAAAVVGLPGEVGSNYAEAPGVIGTGIRSHEVQVLTVPVLMMTLAHTPHRSRIDR
jgi:hypothetical protein